MNDDQTRKTSATGAVESMFPPARELILAGLTFTFFSLEIGILPYLTHACGAFWLFRGFGKLRDLNRPFRQAYRISAAFLLWHVLLFGILVSPAVRILEGVFLTAGLTACRIAMLGFTRKGFRELCDRQGIVPDRDPFLWLAVSQGVLLCAGLTPGLSGVTLIGWASVLWIVYLLYSAAKLTSSIGKQLPPVPAPDRFPGERWMAPACAAACILLASTCVFWNHRPPAAAEVPSRSAEAAQIQAHLAALGAPEQVLSDLTDQDLLTLSSVTEVQVQEEQVSFSIRHSLSDQEEQSLYSTAVCFLTEDQRTFVLEHFTCSGIAPFWQDGLWINSILPPRQPSGQVLFSRNGREWTAPMSSLGTIDGTSYTFFGMSSSVHGLYADFCFPFFSEDQRGYVLYQAGLPSDSDSYSHTAYIRYCHAPGPLRLPYFQTGELLRDQLGQTSGTSLWTASFQVNW